jgi:hypothetical protein
MNRKTLLAVLASVLLPVAASAAPHGILWVQGKNPTRPQSSANMQYFGGPVISHVKVYAVFWGDAVASRTKDLVGPLYSNILDSTYMDWLDEYQTGIQAVDGRRGTGQHIGRGSFGGSFTIHPANASSNLSDQDVQKELDAQIAAGHLPQNDANTLYMTYFPSGYSISIDGQGSCSAFCAYHEGFNSPISGKPVYYGVMPSCGWGCGSQSETSSHECLEAVTDPFPTPGSNPAYPQAWNDPGGQEIADMCAYTSGTVTGHGTTSDVTGLWDNSISGCNSGPWRQNAALNARVLPERIPFLPQAPLLDALRASPAPFAGL